MPMTPVDIIIPVYKNLTLTRDCIESVYSSALSDTTNIVIIVDASPEADLQEYCKSLSGRKNTTVLSNESNLGFVQTVNRGMALNPEHDVILLNSDTQVFSDWWQRMQACAYSQSTIATVTPFSNNATICSYPHLLETFQAPEDMGLAEMDTMFAQVNANKCAMLPTAVGFCMYIKRQVLNELGLFDHEAFGRGYGEECDFSLRARAAGYSNALAADVFVYHYGGVSFGDEGKVLKENAAAVLTERYPNYEADVMTFVSQDPVRELRDRVDDLRLRHSDESVIQVAENLRQYRDILVSSLDVNRSTVIELESLLNTAREDYKTADAELVKTRDVLAQRDASLEDTREQFRVTDEALANTSALVQAKQKELEALGQKVESMGLELTSTKQELNSVLSSRSWRYTQWIRDILEKK